ncbi:NAD(P)-dependent oxidoreductase [Streptomyces sp. NBC_00388]|uniref:NAD(P)-dependent oxidoreductase n=1 Tax=Streptomyces sp. NBC_00388 TaxID=2975735 RepID=UPI002E2178D6
MHITVFGAAGSVGSRVVAEALSRGHEVTAAVRDPARAAALPPAVRVRTGDAGDPDDVAALSEGQDLVISAVRPPAGRESELAVTTAAVLEGVARAGVRVLVVSGAGSLTVPGAGGATVAEGADFPPDWRPIARACDAQLAVCRADTAADWACLSPAALLRPGTRTGRYRLGADELVVGADGSSSLSLEDLAVVLLDEAEKPRHRQVRFTAGY